MDREGFRENEGKREMIRKTKCFSESEGFSVRVKLKKKKKSYEFALTLTV